MQSRALPTRKGSTPISTRRVGVDAASLVWSVVSTRWPVRAASMAMVAVSRSRTSPPRTMTQVDGLAADDARHAAVLGHAALGDVQVAHDLQAGDETRLDVLRRAHHLVEHAVDPVTDPHVLLGRLDVDVGCPVLHGLADQQV